MLQRQHPIGHAGQIVARLHGSNGLGNDGAMVELGSDEMNRCADELAALRQRPGMGIQAGKSRQQGRVDIQHAAGVMADKARREDTHEPCQYQQMRLETVNHALQFGIECSPPVKSPMVDHRRGDAMACGEFKSSRVRAVADHGNDPRRPGLLLAGPHDGLHIGASPRDQNHDALHPPAV